MTLAAMKSALVNRRIIGVLWNTFPSGRGYDVTDPVLLLDNGVTIQFAVQETDVEKYGIRLQITTKFKEKRR